MAITSQFEVPANSETGTDFTNTETSTVAYTFSASGTWTTPYLGDSTAEGFPSFNSYSQAWVKANWPDFEKQMKYPSQTPFSLVAQNKTTGAVTQIGKKATIALKPGETLSFQLNNAPWDYPKSTGTIKVDASGTSVVPKVMQFDGDRDYITLPSMIVNYSEGLTVEAWVYFEEFRNWQRIIDFGNGTDTDNIVFGNYGISKFLALWVKNRLGAREAVTPEILELKQWIHVAVTVDKSSSSQLKNCKFYKAGKEIHSAEIHFPDTVNRTKNYIGRSNWLDQPDFKGKMAEVRLWNKARTVAEIQADMSKHLTGKEPGLVGCWPLNEIKTEGYAQKVADVTGNFPGTVTGTILVEDNTFPIR